MCENNVMLTFIFHDINTIQKHLFMVFGKLCSIELCNWVLLVLESLEKHDKGVMMSCNVVHLPGDCKNFDEIVTALCRNRTIKKSKYHKCTFLAGFECYTN